MQNRINMQGIVDIKQRILTAAERRGGGSVLLVAVTKTVGVDRIIEAIDHGMTDIGENKVQEALNKYPVIANRVRWHLIGHLQSNKVKRAVEIFDMIQTVDSLSLAERIDLACRDIGRPAIDVLLQVNVDRDPDKFGILPEATADLARAISRLPRIRICGLMTIGQLTDDHDKSRATFRSLADLRSTINNLGISGVSIEHLSMGMSGDFEIAISEGSSMVRIGSAIFGSRDQR